MLSNAADRIDLCQGATFFLQMLILESRLSTLHTKVDQLFGGSPKL